MVRTDGNERPFAGPRGFAQSACPNPSSSFQRGAGADDAGQSVEHSFGLMACVPMCIQAQYYIWNVCIPVQQLTFSAIQTSNLLKPLHVSKLGKYHSLPVTKKYSKKKNKASPTSAWCVKPSMKGHPVVTKWNRFCRWLEHKTSRRWARPTQQ